MDQELVDQITSDALMKHIDEKGIQFVDGPKSVSEVDQRKLLADTLNEAINYSPERERREQEYMFGPTIRPRPKKSPSVAKQRKANKAARIARKRK